MKMLKVARFVIDSNPMLMIRVLRVINETYRAAFVSTAGAEGVTALLREGPKTAGQLHDALGLEGAEAELEVWLDLGVSLGELHKAAGAYRLRGSLSRWLADPKNDTALAYLQARIEVIFDYVTQTPRRLREGRRFALDDSAGELFARSSRTVEPLLLETVDQVVPTEGACRLLEVGCGSGSYMRRACERNSELSAVGLELSAQAADFARRNLRDWGFTDQTRVEQIDVRDYSDAEGFDLLTFYNLIYYFPADQRVELLAHLKGLLRPGGRLVLTSLFKSGDPSTRMMDLWSTMTEGCGPLPIESDLMSQLTEAGFRSVEVERILGNYLVLIAR